MTIIVCHVKIGMSSDTLCSGDDGSFYHADKIYRIGNTLLGMAGDSPSCYRFKRWLESGADIDDIPDIDDEFAAMTLNAEGIRHYDHSCEGTPLHHDFYAIGCGDKYALSVMDGVKKPTVKTLKRAVKKACKLNRLCGVDSKGVRFEPV